jgi:hypothetical protein
MAKIRDFTDYRMAIYGAGEHTTTDIHIQFLPKKKNPEANARQNPVVVGFDNPILQKLPANAEVKSIKYNGFKYLFESQRDRAYQTKKVAWSKWKSKHPILSFKEILRAKKIGYMIFPEFCDHKCSRHPECKDEPCKAPEYIEAFHHSIIRQPSGYLRTEPIEYVDDQFGHRLSDIEINTPFMLKAKIENRLYRNLQGTVKYGIQKLFKMGWKVYLIIGVAVLIGVLYYFHLIPGM